MCLRAGCALGGGVWCVYEGLMCAARADSVRRGWWWWWWTVDGLVALIMIIGRWVYPEMVRNFVLDCGISICIPI